MQYDGSLTIGRFISVHVIIIISNAYLFLMMIEVLSNDILFLREWVFSYHRGSGGSWQQLK